MVGNNSQGFAAEPQGPLSFGAGTLTAVSINLEDLQGGAGGGEVELSLIPRYREVPGVTGYERWCSSWAIHRDEILAGKAAIALAGMPSSFSSIRSEDRYGCPETDGMLAAIAMYETGEHEQAITEVGKLKEFDTREPAVRLQDARQNLWRFAGSLAHARIAASEWRHDASDDPKAYDTSGEIEFLAGRYERARLLFSQAVPIARRAIGFPSVEESEALLKLGVTLGRLGRDREALTAFDESGRVASYAEGLSEHLSNSESIGSSLDASFVANNALAQAGLLELGSHEFARAAETYETAAEQLLKSGDTPDLSQESLSRYDVIFNNLALAQAKTGHLHKALASATSAVRVDPLNPLALETEGYIGAQLHRYKLAKEAIEASVIQLPSQFSAWNDLGAIEHLRGRSGRAIIDFRRAIGANPRYALGWFNLGVVLEGEGPQAAFSSQGAFGRAIKLDSQTANRKHEVTLDPNVYITDLDLSKPLPAKWSFSTTDSHSPAVKLGLVLLLLAALQACRAVATSQSTTSSAAQWTLEGLERLGRRIPGARAFTSARIAYAATAAIFLVPLAIAGGAFVEILLLASGIAALVMIVSRSRVLVARRSGAELEQSGWSPGIAFGVLAAIMGFAWAPIPVARIKRNSTAVHLIGPCASAGVALLLFMIGTLLGVPIARTLASIALVMAASMLIPIKPLDGGLIAEQGTKAVTALVFLAGGVLLLLGLH